MKDFMVNNFWMVKSGLEEWFHRDIPVWVALIWYILAAPIGLILAPFAILGTWIYVKIKYWMIEKELD